MAKPWRDILRVRRSWPMFWAWMIPVAIGVYDIFYFIADSEYISACLIAAFTAEIAYLVVRKVKPRRRCSDCGCERR